MSIELLRLIAARSPAALQEAADAIRAQQIGSPLAARRAERAASLALADAAAQWSAEERAALAGLLGAEEARTQYIRLRVSASEKAEVQRVAGETGLSVSNYIRQRLELPLADYDLREES